MSWGHRIAVVLLTVFTTLPAARAFCAMTCLSASGSMASHHASGQRCEDSTSASPTPQLATRSQHDCRTQDGAVLEMATTPVQRADVDVTSLGATTESVHPTLGSRVHSTPSFAYTPSQGTAPPTTTPLVLRV